MLFSHIHHNMSIKTHALAQTMPSPTSSQNPSPCLIIDTPETLDPILRGPQAPLTMADLTLTDRPNLTLHIITFTDTTFVTLTYSHSLMDGVGKREVVTNWSKVLAGRLHDVKPASQPGDDPMAAVAAADQQPGEEPFIHADKALTGWGKWYWVFGLLWWLLRNPTRRQRNLFIPAGAFARIRAEAEQRDTDEESHSDAAAATAAAPPPHLSDGVILTAWLARLACLSMLPQRPISISSAVDLRSCLQPPDIDPSRAYIQNLVAYTWTHLTAATLLHEPLGRAAAAVRASLKTQLTAAQTRAAARVTYCAVRDDGSTKVFTGRRGFVVSVSSVAKAGYLEAVDFGPAVVERTDGGDRGLTPSGMPVWQFSTPQCKIKPPCLIVVQGKDREGNYWVQLVVAAAVWGKIEEYIKTI